MIAQVEPAAALLVPNGPVFRVLITGSRNWRGRAAVWVPLDRLLKHYGQILVIHGDCPSGADLLAREWAEEYEGEGAFQRRFPADWDGAGRGAGYVRNGEMVRFGADLALVFAKPCRKRTRWCPPGEHPSHGTADCVKQARKSKISVKFCPYGMSW